MRDAFYLPDDLRDWPRRGRLDATEMTRGPWDNRAQHGGPPAALLAGAMARFGDDAADFFTARVTIALLRPVPLGALELEVAPERMGRSVQRLTASLRADGREVMTAQGLRIRRAPLGELPTPEDPPWPDPEGAEPFVFPFFQHDVGYHRAVELRVAFGAWGRTPVGFWARPRIPLVAGRETSPLERLMILADAQSGMGLPLDPTDYTFINPDLTVYLERAPRGDWLGFDIRSVAGPQGTGLSQSAIRDRGGVLGRSAQSLVVTPRRLHDQ